MRNAPTQQTTGDKDEPNMRKSQRAQQHETKNTKTHNRITKKR